MEEKIILFVSHKKAQCGVYEFGKNIFDVLTKSESYKFIHAECTSLQDLKAAIAKHSPIAILYNYHPSVLPWVATKMAPYIIRNNIASIKIPQIAIIHEVTQHLADNATGYKRRFLPGNFSRLSNSLFDFYIAPDPTILLKNPIVFKTGRLIPAYENVYPMPDIPTIGSFGFGTPKKGFTKIVDLVQQEFDEAVIRLNIPSADFGDKEGTKAKAIAAECKSRIMKPQIKLQVTHDFFTTEQMLDFLAKNSMNVFLYEDKKGRGLSSTIDNALAVHRPIAVSDSVMFRHLFEIKPSIRVSQNTLKAILANGTKPLNSLYTEWTAAHLVWEYERILAAIFKRIKLPQTIYRPIKRLKTFFRKNFSLPATGFSWLRNTDNIKIDMNTVKNNSYTPITIPAGQSYNRILDNAARELYLPATSKLFELVPAIMELKIPEANVQQAFVFDTIYRNIKNYSSPKMLCVGSYEDTACLSLKKLGYQVEEIDPVSNYFLQEFITKPSIKKNSYDIIFSTSVIEHDPGDESFVICISELLSPGGVAILTCDYNDQWKKGKPLPPVDERLYTQKDIKERLLPLMKGCYFVDEPQWDCLQPDFNLAGKYQYTFASIVVKKSNF